MTTVDIPDSLAKHTRFAYGGVTLDNDIPEPGEALREEIENRANRWPPNLPDSRRAQRPVSTLSADRVQNELRIAFVPLDRRPSTVARSVWCVLNTRDGLDAAGGQTLGQLNGMAAAGLRDLCGWTRAAVAECLNYSTELAPYKAAQRGRSLWRRLNAWPWAYLPSGVSPKGRWGTVPVRLGWELWTSL